MTDHVHDDPEVERVCQFYRAGIVGSDGLRMWWDLVRAEAEAAGDQPPELCTVLGDELNHPRFSRDDVQALRDAAYYCETQSILRDCCYHSSHALFLYSLANRIEAMLGEAQTKGDD